LERGYAGHFGWNGKWDRIGILAQIRVVRVFEVLSPRSARKESGGKGPKAKATADYERPGTDRVTVPDFPLKRPYWRRDSVQQDFEKGRAALTALGTTALRPRGVEN